MLRHVKPVDDVIVERKAKTLRTPNFIEGMYLRPISKHSFLTLCHIIEVHLSFLAFCQDLA